MRKLPRHRNSYRCAFAVTNESEFMQTLLTSEARHQAAQRFAPLAQEQRTHVDTATAAYYLLRRPQTLRGWHSHGEFAISELRPLVLNGRLAWPVAAIRAAMGLPA